MSRLPDSDLRELEGLLDRMKRQPRIGDPLFDMVASTQKLLAALPSLIADLREARERLRELQFGGIDWRDLCLAARARIKELEGKT